MIVACSRSLPMFVMCFFNNLIRIKLKPFVSIIIKVYRKIKVTAFIIVSDSRHLQKLKVFYYLVL